MPEITNDTLVFDDQDLKWFAEYFDDVEWSVYVSGMDEVHACQDPDLSDDDPANPPHTKESARAIAKWINTKLKPRNELDPVMIAAVLHYGVPEQQAVTR